MSQSRSPSRSPSKDRETEEDNRNQGNNLHVANLSYRITEDELYNHFSKYGKIQKIQLITDPVTHESRGFGFVTMEAKKDAEDAANASNGSELAGRNIRVELAKRGTGYAKTPGKYLGVGARRRPPPPREKEYYYRDNRRSRSRSRGRYHDEYKRRDYRRYGESRNYRRYDDYDRRRGDRY